MTEISGTKHDPIVTGNGGDGFDVGEGLGRLDLQDNDALFVAVTQVIGEGNEAVASIGVAAVDRSLADRVETCPLDDLAGFVGGGHVRDDNARRISLKGADVIAVAAFGDAHERVQVVDAGGADLVFQIRPIVGHVFLADPDGVTAAEPGDFDDARVVEINLKARGQLVPAKLGKDAAGAKFHGRKARIRLRVNLRYHSRNASRINAV